MSDNVLRFRPLPDDDPDPVQRAHADGEAFWAGAWGPRTLDDLLDVLDEDDSSLYYKILFVKGVLDARRAT